jgi:hypothetical protein
MEEQAGFRAGRSCIDNIFYITQMIEKKKATNQGVTFIIYWFDKGIWQYTIK